MKIQMLSRAINNHHEHLRGVVQSGGSSIATFFLLPISVVTVAKISQADNVKISN